MRKIWFKLIFSYPLNFLCVFLANIYKYNGIKDETTDLCLTIKLIECVRIGKGCHGGQGAFQLTRIFSQMLCNTVSFTFSD